MVHRKKNDLLHKDTTYIDKSVSPTDSGNVNSLVIVNKLRVSPHYCFVGGVKFPQGEGSAVIDRKKNGPASQIYTYRLWKEFTCGGNRS